MLIVTRLRSLFLAVAIVVFCGAANAAPQVGWYWNPGESGRFFFIESQDGNTFVAGYFYDDDGRATWLTASDPNDDPYNYSGRLQSFSGGQTLFGDYQPPGDPADAGPVTLQFSDDTHATLTWPGGAIALERYIFGEFVDPDPNVGGFQPFAGWWWSAEETGLGYNLEVQGSQLFWVGYMYDDAGKPVWYLSSGSLDSPTSYTGPLLQVGGGQTMSGDYRPPDPPVTVGMLNIEFDAMNEATMTFSDDSAAATEARTPKRIHPKQIVVKKPRPPAFTPPDSYVGQFTQTTVLEAGSLLGSSRTVYKMTGNVIWLTSGYVGVDPIDNNTLYEVAAGSITVSVDHVIAGPAGSCMGKGEQEFPIPEFNLLGLQVNGFYKTWLDLELDVSGLTITINDTCIVPGTGEGTVPVTFNVGNLVLGVNKGVLDHGRVLGTKPPFAAGALTINGNWNFLPP